MPAGESVRAGEFFSQIGMSAAVRNFGSDGHRWLLMEASRK